MRLCAHRQTSEIENYGPIGNLVEFFGSSCKLSRKTDPAVISAPSDRSRRKKKSENLCLSVQLVSRSALIQSYYSSSTNPLKPWTCFHIRVTYGMAWIFSSHLRLWSGIRTCVNGAAPTRDLCKDALPTVTAKLKTSSFWNGQIFCGKKFLSWRLLLSL